MAFVAKALGQKQSSGLSPTMVESNQRLADVSAEQKRQSEAIEAKNESVAKVEAAQRRVRSGRRRGLLAYADGEESTFGGAS